MIMCVGNSMGKTTDAPDLQEVIEVAGVVEAFDFPNGYGWRADDGRRVLLHVSALRAGGYQTATIGARVKCQALGRATSLQAFRVLELARY
ncbi:hypothetical protein [Hyphomicrobium sp.]|uniref:hypothetical protein n=1 Tax=Hyphomicrobium sp. TaxID=82 RepID=UPI003F704597